MSTSGTDVQAPMPAAITISLSVTTCASSCPCRRVCTTLAGFGVAFLRSVVDAVDIAAEAFALAQVGRPADSGRAGRGSAATA